MSSELSNQEQSTEETQTRATRLLRSKSKLPNVFVGESESDDDDGSELEEGIAMEDHYVRLKRMALEYGRTFIELFGVYFFWIFLHYTSAHMYAYWCAPLTFGGFILSPFVVPAPHCQAFRWVITNGSSNIIGMWFTLGTWCVRKFTK
jgi:hypothetical protein